MLPQIVYLCSEHEGTMKFKQGETYEAYFGGKANYKIHIMYVLDSIYDNEKLIVYRYYGKHKQYWHEEMKTATSLELYIEK